MGWVALTPLLLAIAGTGRALRPASPARGFVYGLLAGGVYFAGTLYWTADVMVAFGGLPGPAAVPIAGLLVAYLAVYPAIFGGVVASGVHRYGQRGLWLAPVAWTGTEFLRGYLFTGFPWVALGYSQSTVLPVAQIASVGGVAALSLLVVSVSTALALAVASGRRAGARALAGALGAAVLVAAWGQWRIAQGDLTRDAPTLRVGVVQGNIPQEQKWNPAQSGTILHRYLDLSRTLAASGATLIVWPESATPFFFEEEPTGRQAVLDLARELRAWVLLGSDQIERGPKPTYYNVAFLVSPEGRQAGVYRKRHLVPFGEYVPLRKLLFFAAPLVEGVGDFGVGESVAVLPVDGHSLTTVICYESVFPYLARQAVHRGSQLLTTITNDAWYGWSSAPFQHYEQGRLRAIEFGRYFVRAANTGISAIVDPYGRVLASSPLFETTTLVGEVGLLTGLTLYARIGDAVAWACVAGTVIVWWSTTRRDKGRPT